MVEDTLELVRLRNQFYRDNYRRVTLVLLLSITLNVGMAAAVAYLWQYRPKPVFFATTPTGQIWKMIPLRSPIHTDANVKNWASEAVMAAMTYDFHNYQKQLLAAGEYFTDKAFTEYLTSLKKSGNIEFLTEKRLQADPSLEGLPVILAKSRPGASRFRWDIEMPVAVLYQSASEKIIIHYT